MIFAGTGFLVSRELQEQLRIAEQIQKENAWIFQDHFADSFLGISKLVEDTHMNQTIHKLSYIEERLQLDSVSRILAPFEAAQNKLNSECTKIEKMINPLISSRVFQDMRLNEIARSVSGLSEIFSNNYLSKFESALEDFSYLNNLMSVPISEDEFEKFFIDEDGNVTCDGEFFLKEEVQEQIFNVFFNLIDSVQRFEKGFKEKHKIIYFVLTTYFQLCFLFDVAPTQPLILGMQKIESTINNYDSKYYVCEESANVYETPSSKSKIIDSLSYGETVVSEELYNGWIKITVSMGNNSYQGWIAKCNLINYEKAKFNKDELLNEIE